MFSRRETLAGTAAAGATLFLACATALPAAAETTVEATYAATLAGFPVGSGTLTFDAASNGDWRAAVDAQVRGLATIVANRTASASASGRAGPKAMLSKDYALRIEGGAEPNRVDIDFAGANVKAVSATELHFPGWDRRIPLLPEHKKGVIDPLAAFVLPLAPGQDAMAQANCDHTAKVFDGRVRYDLRMTYGARMEVQGKQGYSGPALVCAVAYRPIAGYRPLSPAEEKFERNLEFSIWFVPAGDARMMIPYKVVVGTPVGLLQVYAHSFTVKGTQTAEDTTASIPTKKR
ncbi:DUF3108 domain-containing protein [Pinisolibacter aquiterrae]|uniref:DUF3108 domain-containing protein n=1 Tax=Pinisolibacter aquiterrae TaxID=2815579 RepID=UPI001C3C87F6|nr:DUF3108 domain-containing protein [Pinisolibacter aquiterrae]MBV5262763.1 DUF3108 domain-containing protein [Pinisolibacter aquiterrae]MCC8233583.1 DUF3108 domain-containing protein [Pinisolibacter aquiterrae]